MPVDTKGERLTVRFFSRDYRAVVEAAKQAGLPVAEYIRRAALAQAEKAASEEKADG